MDAMPPPAPPCRPAESFGFRLWHLTHAWKRRLEAAMAPLGLTHMQFVLLAACHFLASAGTAPTQAGIAAFAELDAMTVSKTLRLLQGKGLLDRSTHPEDTRANRVTLTAAGHAALGAAVPIMRRTQAEFFGRLDAEDEARFSALLDRLLALEGIDLVAPAEDAP